MSKHVLLLQAINASALVLLLAQLTVGVAADRAAGETAPLGDRPAAKTGFIPELTFNGPPQLVWKFTSALDSQDRFPGLSDPATSGGMLFFGDDNGVVRAVTAKQGVTIWTHEHGERIFFPPCCDGKRLYFTTRKGITALESGSGILLWHRPVKHSAGRCVVWEETDTVFFADSDGWTYALNSATGDEQWKDSLMDDAPDDPPDFDGNDARFEGTAARPTGIATDGNMVYQSVFDQCRVVSFDCKTGEKKQSFQTKGWVFADAAIDEERLYVGSQDEHLYCFDKNTGKLRWTHKTNSRIESGPAVTADWVIVASCDGRVYCCDKRTGALVWVSATEQPWAIYSAPIATKDAVYFAAAEGQVYALDLATGAVRWKLRPSETSHLFTSPATDGTRIFVTSRPKDDQIGENTIFAIGPALP